MSRLRHNRATHVRTQVREEHPSGRTGFWAVVIRHWVSTDRRWRARAESFVRDRLREPYLGSPRLSNPQLRACREERPRVAGEGLVVLEQRTVPRVGIGQELGVGRFSLNQYS